MKWYLKIVLYPLLAINFVVAVSMIASAYSPLLPPERLALLSLGGLAFPFVLAANVAFLFVWLFIYRRFMWLSLLACAVCFPQIRAFSPINFAKQTPPNNSIKLVSYNILSSNLSASTANSENPIVSYLEQSGADIICLQEFPFAVLKRNANARKLFAEYPYKSYLESDESELSAKYLGCLSKYPILSVEMLNFNTSSNGCAKYRIKQGADTIVIYNCHLQSNSLNDDNKSAYEQLLTKPKENLVAVGTKELVKKLRDAAVKRASQAELIIDDMNSETSPYIVVCGDFNDSPISFTRKRLTESLEDAYVNSGNGPGISYNRNKLFYRIDHILHSQGFNSYASEVDRSIKTSDHYPISCYLEKSK